MILREDDMDQEPGEMGTKISSGSHGYLSKSYIKSTRLGVVRRKGLKTFLKIRYLVWKGARHPEPQYSTSWQQIFIVLKGPVSWASHQKKITQEVQGQGQDVASLPFLLL